VLLLGAGPTGLILSQLLKLNGVRKVTLATNKGIKMDIAKQLDAADEYIELARLVEATGVEKLANEAIGYVRRGGTLIIYGVYENKALVHWPPTKIFGDEVRVRCSCSRLRKLF
jgi:D-arabinitol dehydrogenase (NADP+)